MLKQRETISNNGCFYERNFKLKTSKSQAHDTSKYLLLFKRYRTIRGVFCRVWHPQEGTRKPMSMAPSRDAMPPACRSAKLVEHGERVIRMTVIRPSIDSDGIESRDERPYPPTTNGKDTNTGTADIAGKHASQANVDTAAHPMRAANVDLVACCATHNSAQFLLSQFYILKAFYYIIHYYKSPFLHFLLDNFQKKECLAARLECYDIEIHSDVICLNIECLIVESRDEWAYAGASDAENTDAGTAHTAGTLPKIANRANRATRSHSQFIFSQFYVVENIR